MISVCHGTKLREVNDPRGEWTIKDYFIGLKFNAWIDNFCQKHFKKITKTGLCYWIYAKPAVYLTFWIAGCMLAIFVGSFILSVQYIF